MVLAKIHFESLDGKEQSARILNRLLNLAQESYGFPAVNKTMIIRQGHEHHGANNNLCNRQLLESVRTNRMILLSFYLSVAGHWTIKDTMHAQNRRLRRVDNGGSKQ